MYNIMLTALLGDIKKERISEEDTVYILRNKYQEIENWYYEVDTLPKMFRKTLEEGTVLELISEMKGLI